MKKFELTTTVKNVFFPEEPDLLDDPADNFVEACKYTPATLIHKALPADVIEAVPAYRNSVPRSTKFFQGTPTIRLPKPVMSQAPLGNLLRKRRTRYAEKTASISLQALTNVLHGAYGVTGKIQQIGVSQRAVPSAGALYPLDIYWVSHKVDELERGLYHYNPLRHQFEVVKQGPEPAEALGAAMVQPEMFREKVGHLIITSAFGRNRFKYGVRGYRFALLEAGHVAQNIFLLSEAEGMLCACLGGYYDNLVDDLLNLDGVNETAIYVIALSRAT